MVSAANNTPDEMATKGLKTDEKVNPPPGPPPGSSEEKAPENPAAGFSAFVSSVISCPNSFDRI
jgi:hypothetical protein